MKLKGNHGTVFFVIGMVLVAIYALGIANGRWQTRSYFEAELIKRDLAQYNEKTGVFEFKEKREKKTK